MTEHASKLSLSKGWHFNPVSPKCLKLGTHDLLLMGNKKVSRTHNVTSMDLHSIAFQIEYPIGKSAAWIFLYSDKLCRIYIFPWFAIFGGTRHCCLQLYLRMCFSEIWI